MDILEILEADYQRFPINQTYNIYHPNVYFKDPLNEFRGLAKYKQNIAFISTWFREIKLELHGMSQTENTIKTQWTLKWIAPVPWKPPIAIPGWSELQLDSDNLIVSHIDYWDCSRWDVLKQHFVFVRN